MNIDVSTLSDDELNELEMYIGFSISQLGDPENEKICKFFESLIKRIQEVKSERWRNDPRNWGASCTLSDDDLPF